ncbi:MAG: hypothetical protein ACOH1H_12015 [Brevundimonas sp.]
MRPDHKEFMDGLKLAAIAIASAVLTATLVIGAGRAVLDRPVQALADSATDLVQTSAR